MGKFRVFIGDEISGDSFIAPKGKSLKELIAWKIAYNKRISRNEPAVRKIVKIKSRIKKPKPSRKDKLKELIKKELKI